MSTIEEAVEIDGEKLMQFVFRAVDEVGATLNTALVVMGDRLGLYRALAGAGPLSPGELAERTGTAERYVREWLNAQAAGGYVEYDPESSRYTLPPEQAVALTGSRRTSTRWDAPTTGSPRCCAPRHRSPRRSGSRSAPRPVRQGSGTSLPPAALPGSAGPRRHRSTSSTKRAPDHPAHGGMTGRASRQERAGAAR
jgi:hypothetical protein